MFGSDPDDTRDFRNSRYGRIPAQCCGAGGGRNPGAWQRHSLRSTFKYTVLGSATGKSFCSRPDDRLRSRHNLYRPGRSGSPRCLSELGFEQSSWAHQRVVLGEFNNLPSLLPVFTVAPHKVGDMVRYCYQPAGGLAAGLVLISSDRMQTVLKTKTLATNSLQKH